MTALIELTERLRRAPGLRSKTEIQPICSAFGSEVQSAWLTPRVALLNGDDAAVIPDGEGYLLFAAEGIIPEFVRRDPWFAGFCSVMVNINDIAAMGGVPYAVTDVLLAAQGTDVAELLHGMRAASALFGVPIVGGHTGRAQSETFLSVSIVGRARALLSGFAARPGHSLVAAVDLRGDYRGSYPHFDAATIATPEQVRCNVALLAAVAEAGLACAAKDVSQAGTAGTLAMLCETSGVGAVLHSNRLPRPDGVDVFRWLTSFPSFGFLLACRSDRVDALTAVFHRAGVAAAEVGQFITEPCVYLAEGSERAVFWDFSRERLTGMGRLECESGVEGVCKKAS